MEILGQVGGLLLRCRYKRIWRTARVFLGSSGTMWASTTTITMRATWSKPDLPGSERRRKSFKNRTTRTRRRLQKAARKMMSQRRLPPEMKAKEGLRLSIRKGRERLWPSSPQGRESEASRPKRNISLTPMMPRNRTTCLSRPYDLKARSAQKPWLLPRMRQTTTTNT
ncbi:hypothetical protein BD311DRAFT_199500 [Dichomitus squalens]|uniref:Uncharacterized protein n=1 Tax=Dichomitus squalens TaxID=114155 RepID=A0A4Q9N754_9APHY|nr:hypothetical protein BD311DRAFT_199500 [Dichomitus squalens]